MHQNSIQKLLQQILPLVVQIGRDPADSDEVQLQKTLLVLGSMMFIAAGALWVEYSAEKCERMNEILQ